MTRKKRSRARAVLIPFFKMRCSCGHVQHEPSWLPEMTPAEKAEINQMFNGLYTAEDFNGFRIKPDWTDCEACGKHYAKTRVKFEE